MKRKAKIQTITMLDSNTIVYKGTYNKEVGQI